MLPVPAGAPADSDFDALPLDGVPAFDLPNRLKTDAPIWREAQNALYRVAPSLISAAWHAALDNAVEDTRRARGQGFPAWALDQAGIDVMMANRVTVGPDWRRRGSAGSCSSTRSSCRSTQRRGGPHARHALALSARGEAAEAVPERPDVRALPATLDEYVDKVVDPTLARVRTAGAVGIKFEAGYLRPLDFDDPDPPAARASTRSTRAAACRPAPRPRRSRTSCSARSRARRGGRSCRSRSTRSRRSAASTRPRGSAPHLLEPAFNDSTLRGARSSSSTAAGRSSARRRPCSPSRTSTPTSR